jgi:hypothetical protein
MDTERYCLTLDQLDREKAIRAIHQAYLQLAATMPAAIAEGYDNTPAARALVECLKDAGHMGFNPQAGRVA